MAQKITWRDPSLEHQIVITSRSGVTKLIEVSCNCRRRTGRPPGPPSYEMIEGRARWEAPDAWEVWTGWHRARGIEVRRPSEELAEVNG